MTYYFAEDEVLPIVIDVGENSLKLGMGGSPEPVACFPTLVSRRIGIPTQAGIDSYVGPNALAFREGFAAERTIEGGVVVNYDDFEKLLHYSFYSALWRAPEEHPVLISEPIQTPKAQSEKMTQILFETFNVPAKHLARAPELALHGLPHSGTALMVDMGHHATTVLPIYEGTVLKDRALKTTVGGKHVTDALSQHLSTGSRLPMHSLYHYEVCSNIKEEAAYVAFDYEAELKKYKETQLTALPHLLTNSGQAGMMEYHVEDKGTVTLGIERFQITEVWFQPWLFGLEDRSQPLQETIVNCIRSCDIDTRKELLANIALVGGGALAPGLAERLKKEIQPLVPSPVSIHLYPRRSLAAWLGGSHLSVQPTFQQVWTSKEEYDESGPSITIRKIF
jgi:actin beta/gamma 1